MIQQIYPSVAHRYSYELNKDFHFSAAHYIKDEEAGKCNQVHGHTYFVNLTIAGDTLDKMGFLVNFTQLKREIHARFDHTLLNEHAEFFNDQQPEFYPSTENVARVICEIVQQYLDEHNKEARCLQVFLRETPSSYVVYRPKWSGEE